MNEGGESSRPSGALDGIDLWLVDRLAVPASLHDVRGRFLHMNVGAERASGFSNAELRGGHFTDLVPEGARDSVARLFRRAVERAEPTDFETVFVDAAGDTRRTRAQHLPLVEDGQVVGVLIIAFGATWLASASDGDIPATPHLTGRQRQILELMATGLSTTQIARELTLSRETVRNHLRGAYRELGAHTRVEAIAKARRLGLLSSPPLGPSASWRR